MRRLVAFIGLTAVLLISGQVVASEVLSENARLRSRSSTNFVNAG